MVEKIVMGWQYDYVLKDEAWIISESLSINLKKDDWGITIEVYEIDKESDEPLASTGYKFIVREK